MGGKLSELEWGGRGVGNVKLNESNQKQTMKQQWKASPVDIVGQKIIGGLEAEFAESTSKFNKISK